MRATPELCRTPVGRGSPPGLAGTYALLLRVATPATVEVGRLGALELAAGCYLYVGSALGPGGLAGRVARHLREDKPAHWHIDHLRAVAEPLEVWWQADPERLEHHWARTLAALPGAGIPMAGFGASDCRCPAHLLALAAPASAFAALAGQAGAARGRPIGHHRHRSP